MRPLLALLLATLSPAAITAQTLQSDTGCTFDTCALRIQYRFWGPRLVRGMDDEVVAGLGPFSGRVDIFAERSETAARFYDAFRSKDPIALVAVVVGSGALAVAIAAARKDNEALAIPMLVIGGGLGVLGTATARSARNDLESAVWRYDRTLPRPQHADSPRRGSSTDTSVEDP